MLILKYVKIIFLCLIITSLVCACNEIENNNNSNGTIIEMKNNDIKNEEYEAKIYYDGDHYVLNVFTNLIEREFKFSYNTEEFLLDNTGVFFEENASYEDEGNIRTYKVKMNSNELYEFNFITNEKKELIIGKNLIID